MSTCANPRCDQPAGKGQLACRPCWFSLPKPLREGIVSTWAARASDGRAAWSANVLEARKIWAAKAVAK